MPASPDDSIIAIRKRLLDGMTSYLEATSGQSDCGYTQQHIDQCAAIIDNYLLTMDPDRQLTSEQILEDVKQAVLKLNELNDLCSGGLIETDQREDLCELILSAALKAGLDTNEDVTEPWREW